MSVMTLGIDELVDPGNVDVETLEGLDGRELAELFKRLERLRRRTEGALAAVIGAVNERGVHGRRWAQQRQWLVSGVGPLVRHGVSGPDPYRQR